MKMSQRRRTITMGGGILLLLCSLILVDSLNQYCRYEVVGQCQQLWILACMSIVGTIIAFEAFIAWRFKNRHNSPPDIVHTMENPEGEQGENIWRRAMTKSTIRLTVGMILMAMPWLVQKVFVVTGLSIFVGIAADGFVRGVINRLPTMQTSVRP